MEIFILTNLLLICSHKRNAYSLGNLSVFLSVDIPLMVNILNYKNIE